MDARGSGMLRLVEDVAGSDCPPLHAVDFSDPLRRPDRRFVQLRAYIVRETKEILEAAVVDLSYSGCSVDTDTPLIAGEAVLISVLGRGGGKATVRWCRDGRAGLEFDGYEGTREHVHRSSERLPIAAEVLLRRSASRGCRVRVFDTSPLGCKCEFLDRPRVEERVWVKFDFLEAIEAQVRWVKGRSAGLKFMTSIHPAVFEMLAERLAIAS